MRLIKDFQLFQEAEVYDITDEVKPRLLRKPQLKEDRHFVIHHTGGLGSASSVVKILNHRGLSVQWVVDLQGRIFQTLPLGMQGAHSNRKKIHEKKPGIATNSTAQGVEVVGKNDQDIKQRMEEDIRQYGYPRQAQAVLTIIKHLGYDKGDIYTHGELSKNKADDEGLTIRNWVMNNWDTPVDLSGFKNITTRKPPKDSPTETTTQTSKATTKTSKSTNDGGSVRVTQNYGYGKKFGVEQEKSYQTYKTNPLVYWAVYDVDRGGFIKQSQGSDKLIYAASVSKAVTGACAVNRNGGSLPTQKDLNDLTLLLVKSKNEPYWGRITRLGGGGEEINRWSSQMGWNVLPGNYLKKRIANKNSVSADGMCLFWRDVLNNKFSGAEIIRKLSGACQTSGKRSKVYTPKDCKIGGKTGLYKRYMHDTAWIIAPNGRRYVIAVLTELKSTSIVATMFGGLWREYCQPTFDQVKPITPQEQKLQKQTPTTPIPTGPNGQLPIVFIGGLDYRAGDYNIREQAKLLKTSLPKGKKIFAFRYLNHANAVEKIKELQGNCQVVVFSKGGDWADDCAEQIKDKKMMFILEPYGAGKTAKDSVNRAVNIGVPPQNVIVGSTSGTGAGIVSGTSKTPRGEQYKAPNGSYHFGGLKWVSELISKL
jgi:hypothetical protein